MKTATELLEWLKGPRGRMITINTAKTDIRIWVSCVKECVNDTLVLRHFDTSRPGNNTRAAETRWANISGFELFVEVPRNGLWYRVDCPIPVRIGTRITTYATASHCCVRRSGDGQTLDIEF